MDAMTAGSLEETLEADYLVVGSGAGGATAAVTLAEGGADTLILEEGAWRRREEFTPDLYGAMSRLFRGFGSQVARGTSLIPVLEGCCVGGSTVINGAIVHRLPEEVHAAWLREDPALRDRLPYKALASCAESIEADLGIRANLDSLLAELPAAGVLKRQGWAPSAMKRNAPGCQATGRCLQGCPSGGKLSMEASYIPRALRVGARLATGCRVESIIWEGRRASGVRVKDAAGRRRLARARRAVLLAAGTVQTPRLLDRSGLGRALPEIGRHFQCHLGIGIVGRLDCDAALVEGPPQGIEARVPGEEGVKLATQLLPPELLLARAGIVGDDLAQTLREWRKLSSWTASVRSDAEGEVLAGWIGSPSIVFRPSRRDMERLRRALWHLTRLLFELGAREVFPPVAGLPARLTEPAEAQLILSASLDPRDYPIVVGHMFGTCRMAGDRARGVVGPDFSVHGAEGLYVADGSIFPTNLGVNPQHAIMTMARHAARGILGS